MFVLSDLKLENYLAANKRNVDTDQQQLFFRDGAVFTKEVECNAKADESLTSTELFICLRRLSVTCEMYFVPTEPGPEEKLGQQIILLLVECNAKADESLTSTELFICLRRLSVTCEMYFVPTEPGPEEKLGQQIILLLANPIETLTPISTGIASIGFDLGVWQTLLWDKIMDKDRDAAVFWPRNEYNHGGDAQGRRRDEYYCGGDAQGGHREEGWRGDRREGRWDDRFGGDRNEGNSRAGQSFRGDGVQRGGQSFQDDEEDRRGNRNNCHRSDEIDACQTNTPYFSAPTHATRKVTQRQGLGDAFKKTVLPTLEEEVSAHDTHNKLCFAKKLTVNQQGLSTGFQVSNAESFTRHTLEHICVTSFGINWLAIQGKNSLREKTAFYIVAYQDLDQH
ncbi:hypothetical protein B0H16DRAFT_1479508 [Mycena metata]|uniref:Uncharacterized protein n=1 Tax=Mycena metata TaxID=1033252 RepID=A0AAD7H577_9AGAR|nr:hypothetical protein B0H16DRAFT_1479508 [Mycena metata]